MRIVVYTADDEEPMCLCCDNMLASDECCNECNKTGWGNYSRAERVDD